MNVIVYHPKSPENIYILQKKVAFVHSEAVLRYIKKLSCSREQKFKMLTEIKEKGLQ